ncbi:MAG: hypothetical protein KGJ93_05125 [Patescibacteria group bacterium]|nr:hypothetical protein [Patescibacteria group bacterium]
MALASYEDVVRVCVQMVPGQSQAFEYTGVFCEWTWRAFVSALGAGSPFRRPGIRFKFGWQVFPAGSLGNSSVRIECSASSLVRPGQESGVVAELYDDFPDPDISLA